MVPATTRQKLASCVVERRLEIGLPTTKSLAERSDISARLLGDVENGRRDSYSKATLWALDKALEWVPGSAQAVLDGGEPTPLAPSAPTPGPALVDEVAGESLAELLIGESADELAEDEISEIESVARAAALKRKREILASRPATRALEPAGEAEEELPDFTQLAARTVTRRPGWDASQTGADTGEEPQD